MFWREEVADGNTALGFRDWLNNQLRRPHDHERWMLDDSAKGGQYCRACGEHVIEKGERLMISREQAEAWVGHPLTDEQAEWIEEAIPNSSIPSAIETIAHEALGLEDETQPEEGSTHHGIVRTPTSTAGTPSQPFTDGDPQRRWTRALP